jgi:hypothetical protein
MKVISLCVSCKAQEVLYEDPKDTRKDEIEKDLCEDCRHLQFGDKW